MISSCVTAEMLYYEQYVNNQVALLNSMLQLYVCPHVIFMVVLCMLIFFGSFITLLYDIHVKKKHLFY